jgi:predicted transcriptional regulator
MNKDSHKTMQVIFDILKIIRGVDTLISDMYVAANLGFSDFEDAVATSTAIREHSDYIITRNIKDFSNSPIPVITPIDFLHKHQY